MRDCACELLGRGLVLLGGRVVGLGRADLELHALVEEEVAIRARTRREGRAAASRSRRSSSTSPSLKLGARAPASSASAARPGRSAGERQRGAREQAEHPIRHGASTHLAAPGVERVLEVDVSQRCVVIDFATSSAPQRANSAALSQRVPPPGYCRARRIASVIACWVSSKRPVQSRRAVGAS